MTPERNLQEAGSTAGGAVPSARRPKPSRRRREPKPRQDLLLAIGDSWFNYWPRGDILDVLDDRKLYTVRRSAQSGRKLAEMLYRTPPSLLAELDDREVDGVEIGWLLGAIAGLAPADKPRLLAVLVSAGGNDVAGDAQVLRTLVRRHARNEDPIDAAQAAAIVDRRMRGLYETLLRRVTRVCEYALGRKVPILFHGYDHPVPDGRGALSPPWLQPVLEGLGYRELGDRKRVMRLLIDRLNLMQQDLLRQDEFRHVWHVDLRGTLSAADDSYRYHWQNELHPTIPDGFVKVAERFVDALAKVAKKPLRPAAKAAERARDASASTSRRSPASPDRATRALLLAVRGPT